MNQALTSEAARLRRLREDQVHQALPSVAKLEVSGENNEASSIAAALRYRKELGLGTIPVDAEEKRPRFKRWQNGGLRAEASIVKVFGRWPEETFVGVPTGYALVDGGYLYVLDVDLRNGGAEAFAALPELPETVTARTPNGWHYWFRTPIAIPGQFREDGLELKGAGQYVVVPPAPGRHWLRNPFEFEIAESPDWLLPQPEALPEKPLEVVVDKVTGEVELDFSDPLAQIRAARPGSRRQTLLRQAGRLKYRADHGRLSASSAYEALLAAACESGLTAAQAQRVLAWVFKQPATTNTLGERAEGHRTYVVTAVTERELDVLGAICEAFTARSAEYGVSFERQRSDIFSLRWVCKHTGLRHQEQARRSIEKLIAAELLWRNPYPKRLKAGQRPCDRYRPTYAGLAIANRESPT